MTWTVKQELCVYDDRGYAVATAETPELAARIVAMAAENERLRKALQVPAVWTEEERDGMAAAYRKAAEKHGHYESIFAVATWLLRNRLKGTLTTMEGAAVIKNQCPTCGHIETGFEQEEWALNQGRISERDSKIAHLREIIRLYNPDDALFDEENGGLRPFTDADAIAEMRRAMKGGK